MAKGIWATRNCKSYIFKEAVLESQIQSTAKQLAQRKLQQQVDQDLQKEGIQQLSYDQFLISN